MSPRTSRLPQRGAGTGTYALLFVVVAAVAAAAIAVPRILETPAPRPRPTPVPCVASLTAPRACTAWVWGYNQFGEAGNGVTGVDLHAPAHWAVPGTGSSGATVLGVGGTAYHELLISDGHLWAWGSDQYGELGDGHLGTQAVQPTPEQITGMTSVKAAATGAYFSLVVRSDGTLWAMGADDYGQLGDGNHGAAATRDTPVQVFATGMDHVVAAAAGDNTGYALTADGSVWAWGRNEHGELGTGDRSERHVATRVPGLGTVKALAAGSGHCLALLSDGTVRAWGNGQTGQLGDGTAGADSWSPVPVAGLKLVTQIAAGAFHSLAVTGDGHLYCWGRNEYGELGIGTAGESTDTTTPQPVATMSRVTGISAGYRASFAINAGGVYAWGLNNVGQLGTDFPAQHDAPVRVNLSGTAVAISAGVDQAIALTA